ncbi:MAG: hypothetical protein EAZ07_02615 [Cytophagales bacterium]|nr:MAG: hypothetical protein EAZ07_02615 [Cytophagales bacterium]
MKTSLFCAIFLIIHTVSQAQWLKNYRNFYDSELLRDFFITSLIEDQKGNIWVTSFGTGVIKITPQGDTIHYSEPDGLVYNYVEEVAEDKNGDIWFATTDGLGRYDGKEWFKYFESNKTSIVPYHAFTDICKDNQGNLWFTNNIGNSNSSIWQIHKFDGNELTLKFEFKNSFTNHTNEMVCSKSNEIYLETNNGARKIINDQMYEVPSLRNFNISSMQFDNNNILWVANENNIYLLKNDIIIDSIIINTKGFEDRNLFIRTIFFDKDNNIYISEGDDIKTLKNNEWVNTGLYHPHYNRSLIQLRSGDLLAGNYYGYLSRKNNEVIKTSELAYKDITSDWVAAIDIDSKGNKYIAFNQRLDFEEGFEIFDGKDWKKIDNNINCFYPTFITIDSKNQIWGLDQNANVFNLKNEDTKILFNKDSAKCNETFQNSSSIVEDAQYHLWVGGYRNIYQYNGKSWKTYHPDTDSILDLTRTVVDKFDNKWFVSEKGYLLKFDNKKWQKIPLPYDVNKHTFNHFEIDTDQQGNIWVSTTNRGAWVYDGKNWKNFNSSNGLKTDTLSGITIERDLGLVWLLSGNETSRYNGNKWDYPFKDLFYKSINLTCLKRDIDSTYWIGSFSNGLFHWKEGKSILTTKEPIYSDINSSIKFSSYPNPVEKYLYFNTSKAIKEVHIYSIIGELLISNKHFDGYQIEIPPNILNNQNVYFYKAIDEDHIEHSGKFIYSK